MRIFLVIFDSLRKDHTGKIYGNDWIHTPNFDKFAKDSIVFERAYPESLATIPVRRAIHTGLRTFPFNHNKPKLRTDDVVKLPGWDPIPPEQIHLSEYLKTDGYFSSFITSTYHQFKPNMNFHLGFDQWNWIRGHEIDKYRVRYREDKTKFRDVIDDYIIKNESINRNHQKQILNVYLSNIQDRRNEEDYFPPQTFKKAIEFVKDTKKIKNVLCVIDEFDPHEPWDPPANYLEMYSDKDYSGKKIITPSYSENIDYLSNDELKYMRACYAGEVSLCDNWFGYFIEELKNLEFYDNSLIIFISDHGHSIGEHNATGKLPMFMYPELVDIPLMIKPPGCIKGPKRIKKSYVYCHDILPTIFGFLSKPISEHFQGIDLSVFQDEDDHLINNRDYITCGYSICTLYKDDNYALITTNDKKYQKLFNLEKDPEWNNNIAKENPELDEELFKKIEKDANGDLLLEWKTRMDELKDWYIQKSPS
ncbi:MAG: sulfatase [Promethearchaeota archaeon]